MLQIFTNRFDVYWLLAVLAFDQLLWLALVRYKARRAWRDGFTAGASRSADMVKNGFANPSHSIHKLYL